MKLSEKITQAMLEGQVRDFSDAYQGAMEEVAIWKRRALEAEDLNRKFIAEINGPAYMGEPAQPAPSMPKLRVGNLPTINQDGYPALGAWWVQLWDGDDVFARAYGSTPEEAHNRAEMLVAAGNGRGAE